MRERLYNNWGFCALCIAFCGNHLKNLSIGNCLLVYPFVTHRSLIGYLARKTTIVKSIEQLIVMNPNWFSNFDLRFTSGLVPSINAIQYLLESEIITLEGGRLVFLESLEYDVSMGKRAEVVSRAAKNISILIEMKPEILYSNLRIAL